MDAIRYSVAIAEVEIWVPANEGPRYEAVDGLIGFSSQLRGIGVNGTIQDGGVKLTTGGVLEIADVRSQTNGGATNVTVIGYGGDVIVGLNYLQNVTASLPESEGGNVTIEVNMLSGSNVVTMYQSGNHSVWLEAIVVA